MTFNRPVWATRPTMRAWNDSRVSSFVFTVSTLEDQADECGTPPLWRCIDVSTLWGWRHEV